MHGDEGDLEAADEEAGDEELIGAVAEGLAERLDDALVGLAAARSATAFGLPRMTIARNGTSERDRRHDEERGSPSIVMDEGLAERRENELAGRAGGRAEAVGEGAHVIGEEPGEGGEDEQERRPGDAEADEDAGGELQRERVGGLRHQGEAERVEERAAGQDARRPELVGDHADERLRRAPDEVLDGDGEREGLAAPAVARSSSASGRSPWSSVGRSRSRRSGSRRR